MRRILFRDKKIYAEVELIMPEKKFESNNMVFMSRPNTTHSQNTTVLQSIYIFRAIRSVAVGGIKIFSSPLLALNSLTRRLFSPPPCVCVQQFGAQQPLIF